MQPNAQDLTYSIYRPDLAALGAIDGFMLSGLPISNNDPLSRRDAGLEFLNVTNRLATTLTGDHDARRREVKVYKITNISKSNVDTHLLVVVHGLSNQARLVNAAWNVKEGGGKFGYFNNYLIDTDPAVIVDVEATPARLSQEIIATKVMLERVEEAHHLRPERLAADKAGGTGPFLGWLSQRKIIPHIPVLDRQHQTDGLLPREAFTFDPEKNHYICPQKKILKHCTARADSPIHIYRATPADGKSCPNRQQCTRGEQRSLSVPFDENLRLEVRALQNTEEFQQSRRLRKKVEMLFAHMKQQFRFTRLKLRGLAGATEEFLWVATVQNLRRLLRLRPPAIPESPRLSIT